MVIYQKQFKPTPRSSLHLADPSLLLLEPTDGHAPCLMVSVLPQTADPYSAVFHHPPILKHMGSSPIIASCTKLANTLNPPFAKQNFIYTDSASLIAKLREIRKWPYFFPSTTMDPDWDVLQQIISSVRLFPSFPEIPFVQGHQDDNHPYTSLSPHSLNVNAGHLAGRYVPHPNENPTIITMIAGSAISLHLLSGTITTKYRSAFCKAASTDRIQ